MPYLTLDFSYSVSHLDPFQCTGCCKENIPQTGNAHAVPSHFYQRRITDPLRLNFGGTTPLRLVPSARDGMCRQKFCWLKEAMKLLQNWYNQGNPKTTFNRDGVIVIMVDNFFQEVLCAEITWMWVGAVAQELFITDRKRMVANSTVLRPKAAAVGSQSHQAAIFKFTSSSIVCCVLSQVHYFELLVQRAIGIQIFFLK